MKKFNKLKKIQELQSRRTAATMRELQGKNRELTQSIKALSHYKDDYMTQLQESTQQGLQGYQLKAYARMLTELQNYINTQCSNMVDNNKALSHSMQLYQAQAMRSKAFSALADRYIKMEKGLQKKLEEKILDEVSLSQFSRRKYR